MDLSLRIFSGRKTGSERYLDECNIGTHSGNARVSIACAVLSRRVNEMTIIGHFEKFLGPIQQGWCEKMRKQTNLA